MALLLVSAGAGVAAESDAAFDWLAVGSVGPNFDSETSGANFVVTASLERRLRILTFRTQIGGFLYGDEVPGKGRENGSFALLSAMDRFGENRWALILLGGIGYYDIPAEADFHVGVGFDYRFHGPWVARGEAIYHHEFSSVAVDVGVGYQF